MIRLRPGRDDFQKLKEPFGKLLPGTPDKTMSALKSLISETPPRRVTAVGDVVSRETLAAGITVNLRIVDNVSMRRPTPAFSLKVKKTYHVKNPAGVISLDAWDTIKRAMKDEEALIVVEGEEDLLALPCVAESPENSLVIYGQPSQGVVVITTTRAAKSNADAILGRMVPEK